MIEVDLLDLICRANDIELSLYSCQSLYMISDRLDRESGYITESRKSLPYKIKILWNIKGDILERDSFPRHDLLAKDAYKNRFRPQILRCD